MDEKKPKSIPLVDEQIQGLGEKLQKEGENYFEENSPLVGVKQNILSPKPENIKKEPDFVIKNLRTYQGDIAEAINKENPSVISIALAERKRSDEQKKNIEKTHSKDNDRKKNIILVSTSLFLIILGIVLVRGFYLVTQKNPQEITPIQESRTILAFDEKKDFESKNFSKKDVVAIIDSNLENWSGNSGNILYLNLFEETPANQSSIDTQNFFSKLNTNIPPNLLRSFGKKFMLGLIKESVPEPFILIEIASFENAFGGMLGWESSLYEDVGLLFSKRTKSNTASLQQTATSTSTSTTPIGNEIEINTSFDDITIKNKDARILKNSRNDTVLLYSFLDKNTLLITSSESVFQDLANRLISRPFLR